VVDVAGEIDRFRLLIDGERRGHVPATRRHAPHQRAVAIEQVYLVVPFALAGEQELTRAVDPGRDVGVDPGRVGVGHHDAAAAGRDTGHDEVERVLVPVQPHEPDRVGTGESQFRYVDVRIGTEVDPGRGGGGEIYHPDPHLGVG